MSALGRRIADVLIPSRLPLLIAAAAFAGLALIPASRLDFDRSIENMFAPDDPLVPPYKQLKRTFGGNEIVMVVYRDERLLAPDRSGIERLRQLSLELKDLAGVKDVLSLAQVDDAMQRLNESILREYEKLPKPLRVTLRVAWFIARTLAAEVPRPLKLLPHLDPVRFVGDGIADPQSALAHRFLQLFEGYTHGSDRQTAAVVCMLQPERQAATPREQTIADIRRVIANLPDDFPPPMIAGEPVMIVDGFRFVEQDGKRLGWASTVLLAVTIILCFRSLRWVIIPIAVVQLTLLLTRATLVWGDFRLSMVSSMLTAIVTVVGVATVVHVIVRFRDGRSAGLTARQSLRNAIVLLAVPVFWACATDAVGFSSLLVTNVGPVQDFGVMMAIGSLLVLVSVALLVPGVALLRLPGSLARFEGGPQRTWREQLLDAQLRRLIRVVQHRPGMTAIGTLCLTAVVGAGVFFVEVESDFTRNFRRGSSIVRSYEFVESHLGGAGVWDITIPAPKTLDWEYLHRVEQLEQRLRREVGATGDAPGGVTKMLSLADIVLQSPPISLEQLPPLLRAEILSRMFVEMRAAMPVFINALEGSDPDAPGHHYTRIMLRARERQSSAEKRRLIQRVREIVDDELGQPGWQQFLNLLPPLPPGRQPTAQVTGIFVLLTRLIDSMLSDQWKAFGVATLGIALMMIVAFRDLRVSLVALVPNVMPILMVLGLMGWLGLKINMGAAMIAAVSMGLSIDSSIHYITSFRRAMASGKSVHESLDEVQQSVGRAMVFSTLALVVGFTVLCFSNFVPTIYFGLLVSLSMLGGLLGNLVVLPLLLSLVTRNPKPPS